MLSVIVYKPWRRRVERKRLQRATFVPVPEYADTETGTESVDQAAVGKPTKDNSGQTTVDITAVGAETQPGSSSVARTGQ